MESKNHCGACYAVRKNREDPRKCILSNAGTRAKRKGIEFSLTLEDIIIPEFCPVFGCKLEKGVGKSNDCSPTLDRIRNNEGYHKNNVIVISHRANRCKNTLNIQDMKTLLAWLENITKERQ